jgi:hypothetical protein
MGAIRIGDHFHDRLSYVNQLEDDFPDYLLEMIDRLTTSKGRYQRIRCLITIQISGITIESEEK